MTSATDDSRGGANSQPQSKNAHGLSGWVRSHPAPRFVAVGGLAVVVDIGLLRLLHGTFGVPVLTATAIAYLASGVPTFLLNFPGISSAWLSERLADLGFGVWSHGNYYSIGLHERIGWGEALRIGLAHYNTPQEIDQFNETLVEFLAKPVSSIGPSS